MISMIVYQCCKQVRGKANFHSRRRHWHIRSKAEVYEGKHEGCGVAVMNKDEGRILSFDAAINVILRNTLLEKWKSVSRIRIWSIKNSGR